MARRGRIDGPGALHHVIQRGMERGRLFHDDRDREEFVRRMGRSLKETGTRCYAWCLMPNHVHLLLSTGERPVSKALQALFAGYAGYFNYRYRRSGHLFQNRYKSTLCESERYMRELVRYIHLNPVRAGLVDGIHGLGRYRWSGHRALLGLDKPEWGGSEEVLERYDQVKSRARRKYVAHLREGLGVGGHPLKGESLRRMVEGGWEVLREVVGVLVKKGPLRVPC